MHLSIDVFDFGDRWLHGHVSARCYSIGKVDDVTHVYLTHYSCRLLADIYLYVFKRLPRTLYLELCDNLTPRVVRVSIANPIGDLTFQRIA